ncbi:heparinase II/III domain-containing protein [Catenovulum agarivorans]|uniref:heparinase II/III domain-containing protein n=1 Tax=Catenovulum agarivorans TaxID=1172192 RepID=UPI000316AA30|nr:heparinase II/III family protein [Catenovulum agarivorans]
MMRQKYTLFARINTAIDSVKPIRTTIQNAKSTLVNVNRWALISSVMLTSASATAVERPMIWLTPAEKVVVEQNIKQHDWANRRYLQLKERADAFAPTSLAARIANIEKLPLQWEKASGAIPAVIDQANIGVNHLRWPLQSSLQSAIDCGILYNFSAEQKYADCAADILYTVVQSLNNTPIGTAPVHLDNRGWIVSENHLLESRIYGAQIPLIYDFIYNYLKAGGQAYDVVQKKLVDFDFSAAQKVFKSYAQLALDSGLVNNNWPVLESSSLVHNALAIDDEKTRNYYLERYLTIDTPHQDSLAKVAKSYVNPGDIWPESLNYSMHVAYFSLYLMNLIDRLEPELQLGNKYPNIATALLTNEHLRYPNHHFPAFGDGNRSYKDNYLEFELAYKSAVLNNNQGLKAVFGNELKHAIATGNYDRAQLLPQHTKAKPYYAPLELLWAEADLGAGESTETFNAYTTVDIPFAGIFIQRNIHTADPVKNGLMATVGGGSYVHGHASGIDLELYGQGHVLGVEAGKGDYPSDVHQNYKRLFAGHNTVISNGASASKGGWIQLGINRVTKAFIEPQPRTSPVSDKYSFVTTNFHDEFNLVKEAFHQRTTALIRLSDDVGYYVDVFRAKSDTDKQFHDYLYRNLSDNLTVTSQNQPVKFTPDPNRYPKAIDVKWSHDRNFAHPGWHFLKDVQSSATSKAGFLATFSADQYKNGPVTMQSRIVAGLDLSVTKVKAPASKIEPAPYNKKPIPMFLLRHQGDVWDNPFALTYESYQGNEQPAIQSTERLMAGDLFKGIVVQAKVAGQQVTQYVLLQQGDKQTYLNEKLGIKFTGHFGVITLTNGKLTDLYIGQGQELSFQGKVLKTEQTAAYRKF